MGKNLVLDDALKLLDDRARQIIKLRFFEGKTQIEVAEEINISRAQVSRLEKMRLKICTDIWKHKQIIEYLVCLC